MPKHGLFTTIGKYLGTKVHNLSEKSKKKGGNLSIPTLLYYKECAISAP